MTIVVDGTEGHSTPETWLQQGEAHATPLGAATSATIENNISLECQSRLAALLTHMEELQTTLRVEQQATRTTTVAPVTTGTILTQALWAEELFNTRTLHVRRPEPLSQRHEDPLQDYDSPLLVDLQATPFPKGFRTPNLTKFKGDSDPDEFVCSYALTIEASGGGPATMAKCFPLALEGVAIRWF